MLGTDEESFPLSLRISEMTSFSEVKFKIQQHCIRQFIIGELWPWAALPPSWVWEGHPGHGHVYHA